MSERYQNRMAYLKTLMDLRQEWEKGLKPLSVMINDHEDTCLVILESTNPDSDKRYHCHRYFTIGSTWEVSVDGRHIPLNAVFSWLNHPSARSTKEHSETVNSYKV